MGRPQAAPHLPAIAACALLTVATPAIAATAPAVADPSREVVVQARRRTAMSDWREARTAHVVVQSDGSEAELTRIAHNLERLHFLLSSLLGRADTAEAPTPLRITLIGDTAEFAAMDLRNTRWQEGPFAAPFDVTHYYDPREDGAVMAVTRIDQKAVLERGVDLSDLQGIQLPGLSLTPEGRQITPGSAAAATAFGSSHASISAPPANERSMPRPAEGILYAAFAQHFLLTYFPAAYPRWYLDGFGQVFSTFAARTDGQLEYGRSPEGVGRVFETFGSYPVRDVLEGRYLQQSSARTGWTPAHAWLLTHYLFFSDARRPQLRRYLLETARGAPPAEAAKAFGDLGALQRELGAYRYAQQPYERVRYPEERAEAPIVHRLTQAQAAFVKGRLELGSRVEIAPEPAAGADPATAARVEALRRDQLAARDRWLARLQADAQRYAAEPEAQVLLAEAECRSGRPAECAGAADRALALEPADSAALTWKGVAQVRQALDGPADGRAAALRLARETLGRANHADTDAPPPLLAYYRSFTTAGEAPPDLAVAALAKASDLTPSAPGPRVELGAVYVARADAADAARALRPVALGPYDSPERPQAQALLARVGAH